MALSPPRLDFSSHTYLTVHLAPTSPYLADPPSIHSVHPAITHVGPVGVLQDVQIVSVPKDEWQRASGAVLASLRDTAGVVRVEVQEEPKMRVKKAGGDL